ncbi:hypothetical protein IFM46972_07814 [Aspergillus udagawae]|uniref:Uncharacterized protein n=1 Tax=Aspergillus udagawae TaxID=91492 RepID=A0A8H3S179_9EURO|nr:hypothetical protein IFM46972_07814 [Aspergillus udagawae]
MPDAETRSNDPSNDADSTRGACSPTNQTGNTTAGGLSNFSAAYPDSAKHVFARTKDEETVNMALVNFLDMLSYYCKEARNLRYILISQHRQEVFVTFAKPGDGYKQYLDEHSDSMTPEESGFLTLHCFGPFDIFDAKHIRAPGHLVLRLTIDANMRCSNQA